MRLVWLSDVHLDHIPYTHQLHFWRTILEADARAMVITGDISNHKWMKKHMERFLQNFFGQIYFVLGNHDGYDSSIGEMEQLADDLCSEFPRLHHLGKGEVVKLTPDTALVGHRGWADGRAGNGIKTPVRTNDFEQISDFSVCPSTRALWAKMRALGNESADYFSKVLPRALACYDNVIVATHVPPFAEAVWHQGLPSSPDFLPHFCNLSAGEAIRNAVSGFENRKITVLCGHTHSAAYYEDNASGITCHVAPAEYGNPQIANILEIP